MEFGRTRAIIDELLKEIDSECGAGEHDKVVIVIAKQINLCCDVNYEHASRLRTGMTPRKQRTT